MKTDKDSAHVPIPPPIILLIFILIGVGLHYLYPLHFVPGAFKWAGGILVGLSIGTILYCATMFKKAHTAIEPWKTTSSIIVKGPYRWSRNPIYLCFIISGFGAAIFLNNLWIALMMIPLVAVINKVVIQREERYLEGKFTNYLEYKQRVRRWI